MLRSTIVRATRLTPRPFAIMSTRGYAEGATGSGFSRAGGEAHGDSFTKREAANEGLFVLEQDREKLRILKAKMAEQRKHLDELEAHIDEFTKQAGGEQH